MNKIYISLSLVLVSMNTTGSLDNYNPLNLEEKDKKTFIELIETCLRVHDTEEKNTENGQKLENLKELLKRHPDFAKMKMNGNLFPIIFPIAFHNEAFFDELLPYHDIQDEKIEDIGFSDSLIHQAALMVNVKAVEKLLEKNSSLATLQESEGQTTPLHQVILASEELLLDEDLKLNFITPDSCKDKQKAHLKKGQLQIIQKILSKNPETCFISDSAGRSPLDLAILKHDFDMVEQIRGASNIDDNQFFNIVLRNRNIEFIKKLSSKMLSQDSFNMLLKLLEKRETSNMLSKLLEKRETSKDLYKLLAESFEKKLSEMFPFLISQGLDINELDSIGESILMKIVGWNDMKLFKELLAAGADINIVNLPNTTIVLIAAVIPGRTEMLEILLSAGADKDTGDMYGYTPLMRAADKCFVENVEALLLAGADVNKVSKDGDTVFKIAKNSFNLANSEHVRVLNMIKDRIEKSKAVDIPCSSCLIA